jgi:hypothetical protein
MEYSGTSLVRTAWDQSFELGAISVLFTAHQNEYEKLFGLTRVRINEGLLYTPLEITHYKGCFAWSDTTAGPLQLACQAL